MRPQFLTSIRCFLNPWRKIDGEGRPGLLKLRLPSVLLTLLSYSALAELCDDDWQLVFNDPGTGDWNERWFVEGLKATVDYDEESLVFTSGPVPMEQASHAVLWTRRALWTAP